MGLLASAAFGDSFQLNNGQTLTADVVSYNETGLMVRPEGGTYERLPWTKFTQDTLKRLAQNPKMAPFVNPFIEITQEERIQRTAVTIKPVPRLDRPEARSVLGALAGSPVGVLALLLIYAANLYAGYEVALFRAQPVGLVCGISAVLPVLGPAVFLAMPTRVAKRAVHAVVEAPAEAAPVEVPVAAEASTGGLALAARPGEAGTATLPQTQIFQRGQFTFNRRFIETKFPGFFGVIKRDAEKDMVLVIKAARGQFIANSITRITGNDMHIEIAKGAASQEVQVPFVEIQEIQLKHRDA